MPRILLKLKSEKDYSYNKSYYHKLQGFIYSMLKDGRYNELHNKKGYKFFCYSNIFPIENNKQGSVKNLLISSPNENFISAVKESLEKTKREDKLINIGEMSFKIENILALNLTLKRGCKLIAATPIVIRIPSYTYDAYGIKSDKKYTYWRKEHSFNAFVKQLNDNIIKKYNYFHNTDIKEIFLFEQFVFKKTIVNHVVIDGKEQKFIGSIWEFIFTHLEPEQRKVLEFGLDAGFGERNSFGFGFVNVV